MIRLDDRVEGGIVIVRPHGRLTVETHGRLSACVREHVTAGRTRVVLNLSDMPYADSIGIAEIVRVHAMTRQAGGRVLLVDVPETVSRLFRVTRLDTVIGTAPAEAVAIATLSRRGD